ncbi:MAG: DUF4416 family protein [Candidatus Auribacterota bacterium]|jgi:hypothetical protein|nr:DUF4416 family protein [Candidatus Auribacterota bacterium]
MGIEKDHLPVMLICAVLAADTDYLARAISSLTGEFGDIAMQSDVIPFDFTEYYNEEMGSSIVRQYFGFERLISPDQIADIKRCTNAIEKTFATGNRRQVNLDPGYLTLAKLVLATTKDATHRLYLRDGIYAESTLFFKAKTFHIWQWTYPDYRAQSTIFFLNELREKYKDKLKSL